MSERIIQADRSLVVAADVQPEVFPRLVENIRDVEGLSAVKIGFEVAWGGLSEAVEVVREHSKKLITIYDHQKGATDIIDTGDNFARGLGRANIDAAILFPFTGPFVAEKWVKALQHQGIGVIVGAEMTHPGFRRSEGGRIADGSILEIFHQAIDLGVTDFVVPGNKVGKVRKYKRYFDIELGEGNYSLFAPGFVAQGGEISEVGKAAGKNWHAIVGRGICDAADVRLAAIEYTQQILSEAA